MRALRATPGGHGIREPRASRNPGASGNSERRGRREGQVGSRRANSLRKPPHGHTTTGADDADAAAGSTKAAPARPAGERGRDTRKARRGQLRPVPTSSHPHLLPGFRGSPRSAGRSARAPGAHAVTPAHRPGHHGAPRFTPPSWPPLAHQPRGRRWRKPRPRGSRCAAIGRETAPARFSWLLIGWSVEPSSIEPPFGAACFAASLGVRAEERDGEC